MKRVLLLLLAAIATATLALGGTAVAQEAVPAPTPASGPAGAAQATSTPLAGPALRSSQPNVLQGQGLRLNDLWVMGELRNDGTAAAYNAVVTARLLAADGAVVASANQMFAYLGPGDAVGYRIEVDNAPPYSRVDLSLDSSATGFATFTKLPVTWVLNQQVQDKKLGVRYEFTGTLGNGGSQPAFLNAICVWFLDDDNRVVWADNSYISNAVSNGDAYTFVARTPWDSQNSQVAGITQVRYYAAGQLP